MPRENELFYLLSRFKTWQSLNDEIGGPEVSSPPQTTTLPVLLSNPAREPILPGEPYGCGISGRLTPGQPVPFVFRTEIEGPLPPPNKRMTSVQKIH